MSLKRQKVSSVVSNSTIKTTEINNHYNINYKYSNEFKLKDYFKHNTNIFSRSQAFWIG